MVPKAVREGGATPKWVPLDTLTPLLKGDPPSRDPYAPSQMCSVPARGFPRGAKGAESFPRRSFAGAFFFRLFWNLLDISGGEAKPAVVWAKPGFQPAFKALKHVRHATPEHSFAPFTMPQRRGRPRPRLFPASLMLPHVAAAAAAALQSDSLEC